MRKIFQITPFYKQKANEAWPVKRNRKSDAKVRDVIRFCKTVTWLVKVQFSWLWKITLLYKEKQIDAMTQKTKICFEKRVLDIVLVVWDKDFWQHYYEYNAAV